MGNDLIAVALPTGRLFPEAVDLFVRLGSTGVETLRDSRRLTIEDRAVGLRFLALKPVDIPVYVEHGAADMGIVGKDLLLEQGRDVYEPVDLGFGACRLVVAEPACLRVREVPIEEAERQARAGGYTLPDDATFLRGKGCDHCRHTDRLPDHQLVNTARNVLGDDALHQSRDTTGDFNILDRPAHLASRLADRLAAFHRDGTSQILKVSLQQVFELEKILDPLCRQGAAPFYIGGGGRLGCLIHLARRREGNLTHHLGSRRVKNV